MPDRKSEAEIPPLIEDSIELAEREARNALEQFDWAIEEVERWISGGRPNLRLSMILDLHRKAMDGIDRYAGNFRPAGVVIRGSNHAPVASADVPRYMEEMLEYIKDNWRKRTAIHLCSYAMWRLNWVHPFVDGNGRTSRMLSYMILCGKLGQILPGTKTIPEQISENKAPYYEALEAADLAYRKGHVDVSHMESLLERYLTNQLVDAQRNSPSSTSKASSVRRSGIVKIIEDHPVVATSIVALLLAVMTIIFT